MKTLMTAGKGGTGKTTILASLLTRHLLHRPRRVLVVDADPHQCLASMLAQAYGLDLAASLGDLRREGGDGLRLVENPDGLSRSDLATLLIQRALTPLPGGHALLAMGANHQPGCQCVVNSLLGRALDLLAERYDLVVVDNEAGLEPIGRHAWPVDALLLVATARPMDLQIAARILEHAQAVRRQIRRTILVFNGLGGGIGLDLPDALQKQIGKTIHLLGGLPDMGDKPGWQDSLLRLNQVIAIALDEEPTDVPAMVPRTRHADR